MSTFTANICVLVVIFCGSVSQACPDYVRSTEEFKTYFEGRCLHYQEVVYKDPFCSSRRNCSELWELFFEAYAGLPQCNVTAGRYERFLEVARHSVPTGKLVFWSNVYELVGRYSNGGRRYFTIANTLAGYIMDNVTWCSNTTEVDGNEANPSRCPGYSPQCLLSAYNSFWSIASTYFAKYAVGEIQIMLNANYKPAFKRNSFFGSEELPYLNSSIVPRAKILLVHTLDTKPIDSCDGESIAELTGLLKNKGIVATCEDSPRDVLLLQCADNPEAADCKQVLTSSSVCFGSTLSLLLVTLMSCFWVFLNISCQ